MLDTRKIIIYGALILWSCLSICSAKPREATMSDSTSVQLHSRAKRGKYSIEIEWIYVNCTGIGLTSTGLATVAGGLVGLLSVMGNPRLRQRIGSIGELADFRRYSRARYKSNLSKIKLFLR